MAYTALYRKYRPTLFKDVIGQNHVITILKNAVIKERISHAYVFSGLRGIGKTTIARIFSKAVNCLNSENGEPCDKCSNCLSIINSETTDVVELDAASNNGVDQMRDILEKVNFLPSRLKKKVYIIDEAHMLSTAAFNALLKTLEEPPAHVIFILATTEPYKIPSTILSRCQRLDFKQLTTQQIVKMLIKVATTEQINIDEEALYGIAEASEGGMRDALSILDQARVYTFDKITLEDINSITGRVSQEKLLEIIKALNEKNTQKALDSINILIESGKEVSRIITCLIQFCRDILFYKSLKDESYITYIYNKDEFIALAEATSERRLFYYADALADIQNKIRYTNSPKIYFEVGIIKIINNANKDINISSRIEKLEEKINLLNPSEGFESLNGILNRLDALENKIKKATSEIEKNNYQAFKEEISSKINLLEDITLKNKGIPTQIEEKLQDLEEKIIELQVINVANVSSNQELKEENNNSEQQTSIDSIEDSKIKEIEERILEVETLIKNIQNNSASSSVDIDINLINKRINDVRADLIDKISKVEPKQTEFQDNSSEVNDRLNVVEEYLDMVIATVDELSKAVKQSETIKNNDGTSNEEIIQLNENYFVLLNLVKSLQDKLDRTNINNPLNNFSNDIQNGISVETFKNEIDERINQLIVNLENKISESRQQSDLKFDEVDNNLVEVKLTINNNREELGSRIDNLENKQQEPTDYMPLINDNTQKINDVKEYSINLSATIQEIQNKVLEINTKLDGGITKRRSPFEVNREEDTEISKSALKEESTIIEENKPKTTTVVEDGEKKIISNSNTVVIRTKPNFDAQKSNETNNVYDIKIVERILYQAHNQQCRIEKPELLAKWNRLEDRVGHLLAPTAKLLSEGMLAANGFNELLIVYPHASMCNSLMESKGHLNAQQVLKITFGKDYDFIALPENTWQEKRSEYAGQFHMGISYPKLTPINNPELKVNVVNTSNLFSKKNTSMYQAQSFFGADIVEKEEE